MISQSEMAKLMAKHLPETVKLDSAKPEAPAQTVVLDAAGESVKHSNQSLSKKALEAFYSLSDLDDDDLDENEGLGSRLKALLAGIVASDNDGEIALSEEDSDQIDVCRSAIGEHLSSKGCDESDISDMLNDWSTEATERCVSAAVETLDDCGEDSDDDDVTMDAIESFVFGEFDCTESDEMIAMDDATFDATYKKKLTVVGGKKKWVKKRVSGKVKLSAKQKIGIKKMLRKSNTSAAKRKRAKTMKQRQRMGL